MEEEKKTEKKKSNMMLWFGILFLVGVNIVLILIKLNYEGFSIGYFFLAEIPVLIIGLVIIFISRISKWIGLAKGKLDVKVSSPVLSSEECGKMARDMLMSDDLLNEVGELHFEGPETHGKDPQSIYCVYCTGAYPDRDNKEVSFFIGINMHYPSLRSVDINPSPAHISTIKRRLVKGSLEDRPDVVESVHEDPLSGRKIITKKKEYPKKKKEEKKEEF